jgi:hypothetical protein
VAAYLNAITGLGTWGDGSQLAALYEDVGTDFVVNAPAANADGIAGLTVGDFVAAIAAAGALDLTAGFGTGATNADDNWEFQVLTAPGVDPIGNLALLNAFTQAGGLGGSLTDFDAGLTILDPTDQFNELVLLARTNTLHQLTVVNGGVSGAADKCFGTVNPFMSTVNTAASTCNGQAVGAFDFGGGVTALYYGFTSNADFNVNSVPEPGSIALLGIALLAFAAARRGVIRR